MRSGSFMPMYKCKNCGYEWCRGGSYVDCKKCGHPESILVRFGYDGEIKRFQIPRDRGSPDSVA